MQDFFSPAIHVFYEHTQIPLAIYYVEDGRFKAYIVSEGACRMYESTPDEMLKRLNGPDPLVNIVEKEEMIKAIKAFSDKDAAYNVVFHEYIGKDRKLKTLHGVGIHEYTRDGRRYSVIRYDEISDSSRRLLFKDEEKEIEDRQRLLFEIDDAIARSYTSVLYVDTDDETVHIVRLNRLGKTLEEEGLEDPHIRHVMDIYVRSLVYKDDAEGVLRFGDFDYVLKRLRDSNPLFHTYRTIRDGRIVYYRLKIIPFDNGSKIIYGFEHFDDQVREKIARENEREIQMTLLAGLSCEYESIWLVDAPIHHAKLIRSNIESEEKSEIMNRVREGNYEAILEDYIERYVIPEDRERVYQLTRIENLIRNTKENEIFHINYYRIDSEKQKNYMQFAVARVTDDMGVVRFVCGFRNIDSVIEEEKNRNMLYSMAHFDDMTGACNRRSFDEFMDEYKNDLPQNDLVVFSFDLNQLKEANDSCGHEAGDELIIGAAKCMRDVLGPYGSVYRTGGDEFAIIANIEENELNDVIEKLKERFDNWRGILFPTLSISMGYVSAADVSDISIDEMRREAEKRMYAHKSEFYQRKGNDRRRQ
ncbi:MAG: GGDEF domain-containing protein [Lachnospiraceae bacterium]|nr:GGDEF domain-containing protein [Lachnospiraceae bacterium]